MAGITADPSIEDGMLLGYTASGELIVSLRYMPEYTRLIGTEADEKRVKEWRTSPLGSRRIAAIAAWNASFPRNPTSGNA